MKSRTSCFNPTLFKKNLTRFAPALALYTLCLILGTVLLYTDDASAKTFWFASRMGEAAQILAVVNLFWAPLTAMLLFGDLYNSRMCNAIHAMPVRRETLFVTNVVSGLTFSILPTAVMAAISVPLLVQTCVVDAWQIAVFFWLGANLSYICFFGIAVFSVFCAGNRLALALIYALINGGAFLIYWLVDTLFTPMFYGVITPERLAIALTPIANMSDDPLVEVESYAELLIRFEGRTEDMVAHFSLTDNWLPWCVYALVGLVFALIGLALYRKRHLERAGDMMAFRWLEPAFVVLFAVLAATAAQFFLYLFLGRNDVNNLFLGAGLVVGWFAGKMLIARSTRVFGIRNWLGLGALAAVIALSFTLVKADMFGIQHWVPQAGEVRSATVGLYSGYREVELTEDGDIENLIRLQELALADPWETAGTYPVDETVTLTGTKGWCTPDGEKYDGEFYYVSNLWLSYQLDSGKLVRRCYKVRVTDEIRALAAEFLSREEAVMDYAYDKELGINLDKVTEISVFSKEVPEEYLTPEDARALYDAILADCKDRTMTQHSYFHNGHFYKASQDGTPLDEEDYAYSKSCWIHIATEDAGFSLDAYPDSENVLRWCRERDLMNGWEVSEKNISGG